MEEARDEIEGSEAFVYQDIDVVSSHQHRLRLY
jgi:hypothetical protein